jgi:predicted PurR-regulated permease PerM
VRICAPLKGDFPATTRAKFPFLVSATAVALYFCCLTTKPFLSPIIFAIVIAIVFYPLHRRVQRTVRNPNLAALLSTMSIALFIPCSLVVLAGAVSAEIRVLFQSLATTDAEGTSLASYFAQMIDNIARWLGRFVDLSKADTPSVLRNWLPQASALLLARAAVLLANTASFAVDGVISCFVLFFLFRDSGSIRKGLAAALPLSLDQVQRLFDAVRDAISANVYGSLIVAFAQGSLTGLAFWILGLQAPLVWGLITAVFSLVPVVGSAAIWAPAAVTLLLTGSWWKGVILLAWGIGVVGLVDNIIRPYVISGRLRLHTLYVFFSLVGGIQAFGLAGIFIGPVVLAIFVALMSLLCEEVREQNMQSEPYGGRPPYTARATDRPRVESAPHLSSKNSNLSTDTI